MIDLLIVTHPHGDHIDEIGLLSQLCFQVRQLSRPQWLTEQEVYAANQLADYTKVANYLGMNSTFSQPILDGQRVGDAPVSGGVSVEVFTSSTCGRSNINNHSLAVGVGYAGFNIMVGGDNEPPSWRCLLENPAFVDAARYTDLFVASHHGRFSGYCADLFEIMKPKLCLISDGRQQDTDATDRYSRHATGFSVRPRNGGPHQQRYAVTTRTDGFIDINVNFSILAGRTIDVWVN